MLGFKEYSIEFDTVSETIILSEEELSLINEVLDTAARIQRKQAFVRRKSKLQLAKKIQARRFASTDRLKTRAKLRARNILIRRLYQGRSKADIPLPQRKAVDQKMVKLRGAVNRISNKLLKRVRQEDIARKTHRKLPKFNQMGTM